MIDPTKPYHNRSPNREADIGGKDEKGNFWGRLKRPSEGWVLWWWDSKGRSLGDPKESENDLIQELELAKKTSIQWNGDNWDAIYDFIYSGNAKSHSLNTNDSICIVTIEGNITVKHGDYIVIDELGNIYIQELRVCE
jgi:hypothetical protein